MMVLSALILAALFTASGATLFEKRQGRGGGIGNLMNGNSKLFPLVSPFVL
jgi:hypothetical protein